MERRSKLGAVVLILAICIITMFSGVSVNAATKASSFHGGSGTKEDPYQIATVEEFELMRLGEQLEYNSSSFYDANFILTNDIYYDSSDPITESGMGLMKCSLDGNSHSVNNITSSGYPLFQWLQDTEVSNITFKNCNIKNAPLLVNNLFQSKLSDFTYEDSKSVMTAVNDKYDDARFGAVVNTLTDSSAENIMIDIDMTFKGYGSVGMLCGFAGGEIDNCKTLGTFDVTAVYKKNHSFIEAGVVCGETDQNITNSVNKASVTVSLPNKKMSIDVGGITGRAGVTWGDGKKESNIISNCSNQGKISLTTKWNKEDEWQYVLIAGIIANVSADSKILNCNNSGKITANNIYAASGIAGDVVGTIENCKNSGSISTTDAYAAAGISFRVEGDVIHCENTGNVKAADTKYYFGGCVASGVVNLLNCESGNSYINNCKNTGNITYVDKWNRSDSAGIVNSMSQNDKYYCTVSDCYNQGTIAGGAIGGIATFSGNYGKSKTKNVIKSCVNAGTLYETYNDDRASGIIFMSQNTTIKGCYNYGNIKREYTEYSDCMAQICGINNEGNNVTGCYILKSSENKYPATGIDQNGGKVSGTKRISKSEMKSMSAVKKIISNAGIK